MDTLEALRSTISDPRTPGFTFIMSEEMVGDLYTARRRGNARWVLRRLLTCLVLASLLLSFGMGWPYQRLSTANGAPTRGCATFTMTAYFATGNPTATGVWPYWGETAVDPNYVPLYSYVRVPSLRDARGRALQFRALDTGSAVGGYHLDVFVPPLANGASDWGTARWVQGNGHRTACWQAKRFNY